MTSSSIRGSEAKGNRLTAAGKSCERVFSRNTWPNASRSQRKRPRTGDPVVTPLLLRLHVLSEGDCAGLLRHISEVADWESGLGTAGARGQERKRNSQIAGDKALAIREQLMDLVLGHPRVQERLMPTLARPPAFAKYQEGDRYDWHVDATVQAGLRTDVSYTIFLNSGFNGGVLELDVGDGQIFPVQGGLGEVVFYEASLRHRVTPVVSGCRYVAVGWIQSLIRDSQKRRIVSQVSRTCSLLASGAPLDKENLLDSLEQLEAQLLRQWAE